MLFRSIIGSHNLPTASLADVTSSIFGQEANSFSLASFSTPLCTAHTNDVMSDLRLGEVGLYPLHGTVSSLSLGGPQPAAGARVDVIGPSPGSCITSSDGQFDFYVRGRQYRVNASKASNWPATVDVLIGAFGKSLTITLVPKPIGGVRLRQ